MKIDYHDGTFNRVIAELSQDFRIVAPVLSKGKGTFSGQDVIAYGDVHDGSEIVTEMKSYFSPKEAVFPAREILFNFRSTGNADNPTEHQIPELDDRDVLIFLRPCDIHGFERLDHVFLENGKNPDFYYERRRKKIRWMMIECAEGFDSCFCVSMGTNEYSDYAAAFRFDGSTVSVHVRDESLMPYFSSGVPSSFTPVYVKENKTVVVVPDASDIKSEHFTSEPWKEYTRRCVNCGRCNTSCPTCSCFTMQDSSSQDGSETRRRRWAGCHVNGFSDMAGGHSFRKLNGERMRFKTLHKIYDFKKRFGIHMCVGCGRCDDVCPEYISFAACINSIGALK